MLRTGSDQLGGGLMRTVQDAVTHGGDRPGRGGPVPGRVGAASSVGPSALRPSAYLLSSLLAVVAAGASAAMWYVPELLNGAPAMDGSARGTALMVLVIGVPLLVWSMWATSRGSARAMFVWAGTVAFLLYQSVLYALATPFNALFLVYEAMLALGIWSAVAMIAQVGVRRLPELFKDRAPVRAMAVFLWIAVSLNAMAWLSKIVPALGESESPAFLEGTGLTTNPIYVQDLAVWLPMMAVAAWWLWHRDGRGLLLGGAMLIAWVLEPLTIAVDQWVGVAADPTATYVSTDVIPIMLVLAAVMSVPTLLFLRSVRPRRPGSSA
jgi:hypothetical protein